MAKRMNAGQAAALGMAIQKMLDGAPRSVRDSVEATLRTMRETEDAAKAPKPPEGGQTNLV